MEVRIDEFPDDAHDILDILMAELAPLDLWLRFAVCSSHAELSWPHRMHKGRVLQARKSRAIQANFDTRYAILISQVCSLVSPFAFRCRTVLSGIKTRADCYSRHFGSVSLEKNIYIIVI